MSIARAKEILKKLITYEPPIPDKRFSDSPTTLAEIDIDRAVNGQPCWEERVAGHTTGRKKFFICDWSIRYQIGNKEQYQAKKAFLEFILDLDVECYVWTGELTRVNDIQSLMKAMTQVELIHLSELQTFLSKQNITHNESEIIDFIRINELQHLLSPLNEKFSPQVFYLENFNHLDPHTLKMIFNYLKEATIDCVGIHDTVSEPLFETFLVWMNELPKLNTLLIHSDVSILKLNQLLEHLPKHTQIIWKLPKEYKKEDDLDKRNRDKIKKLVIQASNINDLELSELLQDCINLTEIEINNCPNIRGYFFSSLSLSNRIISITLQGLNLAGESFSILFSACNSLEKLNINACKGFEDTISNNSSPLFKNLSDLSIGSSSLTDEQLGALLSNSPPLKKLSLYNCQNITGKFLYDEKIKLNLLTELQLKLISSKLTVQEEKEFKTQLTALEKLEISFFKISNKLLARLLNACPNMISLNLSAINLTNNEILNLNHPLEKLERLITINDAEFFMGLSKHQFSDLLAKLPNLQEIKIAKWPDILEDSKFILKKMMQIEFKCKNLSVEILRRLSIHMPNLKKIKFHSLALGDLKSIDNLPTLNAVTEIDITMDQEIIDSDALGLVLSCCPNLTNIKLSFLLSEINPLFKFTLNKLKQLDITYEGGIARFDLSAPLQSLISHCPNLKTLPLSAYPVSVYMKQFILNPKFDLSQFKEIDIKTLAFYDEDLNFSDLADRLNATIARSPYLEKISFKDFTFSDKYFDNLLNQIFMHPLKAIKIFDSGNNTISPLMLMVFNSKWPNTEVITDDAKKEELVPYNLESHEIAPTPQLTAPNWNKPNQPSAIDTNTGNSNQILHARQFFFYKSGEKPHPRNYRLQVYPEIEIGPKINYIPKNQRIESIKKFTEYKNLEVLYQGDQGSKNIFYGQITLPANLNDWFPLPSLTPNDNLIDLSSNTPLELGYCKKQALFYVKPLLPLKEPIEISFLLKTNKQGFITAPVPEIKFKLLQFSQDGKLKKNDDYFKIMEQFNKLSKYEKITALSQFCTRFKLGKLNEIARDDIDKLNSLIRRKKGACRHRVWVFMALAKAFGIKARAIFNDCHAYVEVKQDGQWYRKNLGGAPGHLEIKPIAKLKTKDEIKKPEEKEYLEPRPKKSINPESKNIRFKTISDDNPFITWDTIQSNANTMKDYCQAMLLSASQLPLGKRNLLIILDPNQIELFHSHLSFLKDIPFYYLNSLGDVSERQANITESGQLEKQESELIKFIHAKKKVFVSNWSDYKSPYVGYNTIIDSSDRKLKSHAISDETIVIVLLDKNKAKDMTDDFFSRLRAISTCPDFPEEDSIDKKLRLKENQDRSHLQNVEFFSNDWKNVLLGKITIDGEKFILKEGLLIKALRKNKSGVLLKNAPWGDIKFRLFMTELFHKRTVTVNGNTITLPNDFVLAAMDYDYTLELPKRPAPMLDEKRTQSELILNSQTFKYFIRGRRCENGLIYDQAGWIKQHKNQEILINVTETLLPSQWAELIHLSKKYNCILTPLPQINLENDQIKIIITNDLELTEEKLITQHPKALVVSINANTQFNDLIEKPIKIPGTNPLSFAFESIISNVFKKLFDGETIILKGELAPELAHQLETLFLSPPFLWVNGKKEFPKGKLFFVSDKENPLTLVKAEEQHYTEIDYWNALEEKNKNNPHYLEFKQSAKHLKQENPNVNFTYGQLRAMLEKLEKGKLSNPFKPFFRMNPNDPVLISAKNMWKKPKTAKPDDVLERRSLKISSELSIADYLFIVGDTGIGKTFQILNQLRKQGKNIYVGMDNIKNWLMENDGTDQILFIDEANLEQEGVLDLLEGLFNKTPGILIDGQFYPLSPQHKVIFTGNFSHFTGRQQHRFFERHGQVINFKELPDEVLSSTIIKPALKSIFPQLAETLLNDITLDLLKAYKYVNTTLPNHPFTPRNLKLICLRLSEQLQNHPDIYQNDYKLALKMAIFYEANSLFNKKEKTEFIKAIALDSSEIKKIKATHYKKIPDRIGDMLITKSRKKLMHLLQQQFAIREMILNNPDLSDFEIPSLILEGFSGIGKSKMAIEYLKFLGYEQGQLTDNSPSTTKRYYHITPTDPEIMEATIDKALREGAILIIDELNSMPVEKWINRAYDGFDKDGNKIKIKGFAIVGTQNPITFAGREALSAAFRNRLPIKFLKDYPENELREMVSEICADSIIANHIIDFYMEAKNYAQEYKKKPAPTPRNLFEYLQSKGYALKKISKKLTAEPRLSLWSEELESSKKIPFINPKKTF